MNTNWRPVHWAVAGMLFLGAAFMWIPGSNAQQSGTHSGTPNAQVEAATPGAAEKGGQCIEPTPFMRKNHMNLILHKRDRTVYKGIRTKYASIAECVTCHAKKGDDGQYMTIKNPEHFCRGCHDYTAVTIDCFGCHNSRPDVEQKASLSSGNLKASHGMGVSDNTMTALTGYLGDQQ